MRAMNTQFICEGMSHSAWLDEEEDQWNLRDYDGDPDDDGDFDDPDMDLIDGVGFAEPGGNSALRAATPSNPRNLPCPTCRQPNRLTPIDVQRGYQCDRCADRAEAGLDY